MTISVLCDHCGQQLKAPPELAGRRARCPSCGEKVMITESASQPPLKEENVFQEAGSDWQPSEVVPLEQEKKSRRWWIAALVLLPVLAIVGLVVIPPLLPKDPREIVLQNYLAAVREGNLQEAAKFGVLQEPVRTSSNSRGSWLEDQERVVTGKFQQIADFHAGIDEEYQRRGGVYVKEDASGQLAKLINLADDVKKQNVSPMKVDPRRHRDELDAAVEFAENYLGTLNQLTKIILGDPKQGSIAVTYEQLLKEQGKDLDPAQRELVEHYRRDREKWDRLLGRPFESVRERGDFRMDESTWETDVWLPNQSAGEPPRRVRFKLVRFRLGLIDTGWKVWDRTVP